MRALALTVLHFASHDQFTGNAKIDNFLGHMASVLLVIENFKVYKDAHPGDHHGNGLHDGTRPDRMAPAVHPGFVAWHDPAGVLGSPTSRG